MARIEDFEDHCWKDVIDADTLSVYSCYRRETRVGDKPALLCIDLYNLVYEGGPRPPVETTPQHYNTCGAFAFEAIPHTKKLIAAARRAKLPIFYCTQESRPQNRPLGVGSTRNFRKLDASVYGIYHEFAPQPEALRDALTLTLPDGDAILALGEAFRPRAGTASIVDLRAVGLRSINERTALQVSLDARRRLSESASYSQAETGADVLLGSPEGFRWLGEENAQYSALVRDSLRKGRVFDPAAAVAQHAEMVDAYRQAGVTVHSLAEADELAYGVYARDSSFMTPFGAVICQLANPRRRGEYATTLRFYLEQGIPIYDVVSAGNFEGGDFNMIEPGRVLLGYTDGRSEQVAARQVRAWMEAEGIEVREAPIDEFYVHIDLMVCMLAPKLAAVCLDTTEPDIVAWLRGLGIEIVPASFRETMGLGCNVVALGRDRILSTSFATELNARLRALGFEVYDPCVDQFLWAGGGVHCMAQPLRREAG